MTTVYDPVTDTLRYKVHGRYVLGWTDPKEVTSGLRVGLTENDTNRIFSIDTTVCGYCKSSISRYKSNCTHCGAPTEKL